MPTKQGDVALINDPVAQELLQSSVPARLAYTWKDGSARVIPIAFHWDGREIVMGTPTGAPKVKVIDGQKVAITIDTNEMPCKVLYIRGTAHVTVVDGIVEEYKLAMPRYMGGQAGADAWLAQMAPITPKMARIAVKPEWVGVMDFVGRFPNALEKSMGM